MGVRNYPVIGTFGDSYSTHMDDMYARWGKEGAQIRHGADPSI